MNRIFQFICMLISVFMIASCSPGNEHKFNINTLPPVNLSSGNYHVRNFPSRIRAINDSELILIPVPAKELILFNLYSGDSLAGLSLSGEEIESLKRETVIPEMAGKLIISRDSFVSYTRYDPGNIEFSDISVSGRDVYVAFYLPVYYMDTIRKEYRYYPAVYVGKVEGQEIRDIRYLPGYPMQEGEKNPANILNRDWPFMPYGFKVLDSKIFAFNMTDTARYGNEDVPVLMCYGNCTDKKMRARPDLLSCYLSQQ